MSAILVGICDDAVATSRLVSVTIIVAIFVSLDIMFAILGPAKLFLSSRGVASPCHTHRTASL